ncbi:MAG: hypothetical protein KR126chlam2_00963 [Chlamydiae bacterium]|nr:hypothetical protein [Chlamydiota bacterium]
MEDKLQKLLDELIEGQKEKVLKCGRAFVPRLTGDDALQPNDYPELENNPHFRYEEGILAGLQSAQAAINALLKEETL